MSRRLYLTLAVILVAMSGCGGKSDEKPIRKDAQAAYDIAFQKYDQGYFKEAETMYKRALELDPNLSKAHFDLGIVYDDYLNNKDKAIYHYSMYLKLKPDAEKASMVREWIEKARGEAGVVSTASLPTPEVVRSEEFDYGDAQEKIKSLELEIKAYLATIDELREEVKRLTALQAGDIQAGPSSEKQKDSLERKYEKERIDLLRKFESDRDKLRAGQERANARIRVLEAQVRSYEAQLRKSAKRKAPSSTKAAPAARQVRRKRAPTPAKKPSRAGVTIPSL